jgi:hypothetical protein
VVERDRDGAAAELRLVLARGELPGVRGGRERERERRREERDAGHGREKVDHVEAIGRNWTFDRSRPSPVLPTMFM